MKHTHGRTKMLKRFVIYFGFCLFLLSPLSGWSQAGRENWHDLSPKEKERVRRNYQRWQNLPPQDKEHLRDEWNRWRSLPEDRRDQLKRRYEDMRRRRSND
jgi:hypothetical protein